MIADLKSFISLVEKCINLCFKSQESSLKSFPDTVLLAWVQSLHPKKNKKKQVTWFWSLKNNPPQKIKMYSYTPRKKEIFKNKK